MTTAQDALIGRLAAVRSRIAQACAAAGRDVKGITVVGVGKFHPADALRQAVLAGGLVDLGENYVQEAAAKIDTLADLRGRIVWHQIGPLQRNKTRLVAERFDWVHTVDRIEIAQRLSAQRPAGLPPLQVCLQVNVSGEASKSGVAPDALEALAREVAPLPGLRLRGLMSLPEPTPDTAVQHASHRRLAKLLQDLNQAGVADRPLDTLSMGMSDDLEAAVAEGATMLRIGTAIFGPRPLPAAPT